MDRFNASDILHTVWYRHVLRPRQIKQLFILINETHHVITEPFTKVWAGISCIVFHISPTTPANYYLTVTMEMSSASHKWWCTLIGEGMDFSKLNKGSGTRCSWPDSLRGVSLNLRASNYLWMYLINFYSGVYMSKATNHTWTFLNAAIRDKSSKSVPVNRRVETNRNHFKKSWGSSKLTCWANHLVSTLGDWDTTFMLEGELKKYAKGSDIDAAIKSCFHCLSRRLAKVLIESNVRDQPYLRQVRLCLSPMIQHWRTPLLRPG